MLNNNARRLPEFLSVGRILRPHGIRGGILVEPESDMIRSLDAGMRVYIGEAKDEFLLKSIRPHRNKFLLYFESFTDRTSVESLRGNELLIPFEETTPLPEGVYFHWQILGMQVCTAEGESLGKVSQIIETGANDVYIVSNDASEVLIPAIEEVVLEVDLDNSVMTVHLLPGLID